MVIRYVRFFLDLVSPMSGDRAHFMRLGRLTTRDLVNRARQTSKHKTSQRPAWYWYACSGARSKQPRVEIYQGLLHWVSLRDQFSCRTTSAHGTASYNTRGIRMFQLVNSMSVISSSI